MIGIETSEPDQLTVVRKRAAWHGVARDAVVVGCFVALAVWVTGHVWMSPDTRALVTDPVDQKFMEWVLAYGAHAVTHLTNPFYTFQVNAPAGANMMANTAMTVPAVLLTPVTLTLGPAVSFILLETVALAGTAVAWYVVLRRRLVISRPAAAFGAGLAGFAPGMIALSNAHVHLTALYLVPFIVSLALPAPARRADRPVLRGALLGVLLAAQALTGAEMLLAVVLGTAVFMVAHAALRPAAARPALPTFLVRSASAAVVGGALLAYPLWMMVAGPNHTHGTPWSIYASGTDLAGWFWYSSFSLVGSPGLASRVHAVNPIEQTSDLGIGLVVLLAVLLVALRRNRTAVALSVTGLVFVVLSLGTHLVIFNHDTRVPLPWAALAKLPLVDQALPDRLALVASTAFGVLLALGVEVMIRRGIPRPVVVGALIVALVPILPTPLPARHRDPIPTFFTSGQWRSHVRPGHTMLPVPLLSSVDRRGERWAAGTLDDVALPGGAIMVPRADGSARWGAPLSQLSLRLARISRYGHLPRVNAAFRAAAYRDLAAGRTDCVILDPNVRHAARVRITIDEVLGGPGRYLAGVWVWDVPANAASLGAAYHN